MRQARDHLSWKLLILRVFTTKQKVSPDGDHRGGFGPAPPGILDQRIDSTAVERGIVVAIPLREPRDESLTKFYLGLRVRRGGSMPWPGFACNQRYEKHALRRSDPRVGMARI